MCIRDRPSASNERTVTLLTPPGAIGSGTPTSSTSTAAPGGMGTPRYRGRKTSTGPSTAPGIRPRARARASTTSPRPPVLAHGSHSAATNSTCIRRDGSRAVARASPNWFTIGPRLRQDPGARGGHFLVATSGDFPGPSCRVLGDGSCPFGLSGVVACKEVGSAGRGVQQVVLLAPRGGRRGEGREGLEHSHGLGGHVDRALGELALGNEIPRVVE